MRSLSLELQHLLRAEHLLPLMPERPTCLVVVGGHESDQAVASCEFSDGVLSTVSYPYMRAWHNHVCD